MGLVTDSPAHVMSWKYACKAAIGPKIFQVINHADHKAPSWISVTKTLRCNALSLIPVAHCTVSRVSP